MVKIPKQAGEIAGTYGTTILFWLKKCQEESLQKPLEDGNAHFSHVPSWAVNRLVEKSQDAEFSHLSEKPSLNVRGVHLTPLA